MVWGETTTSHHLFEYEDGTENLGFLWLLKHWMMMKQINLLEVWWTRIRFEAKQPYTKKPIPPNKKIEIQPTSSHFGFFFKDHHLKPRNCGKYVPVTLADMKPFVVFFRVKFFGCLERPLRREDVSKNFIWGGEISLYQPFEDVFFVFFGNISTRILQRMFIWECCSWYSPILKNLPAFRFVVSYIVCTRTKLNSSVRPWKPSIFRCFYLLLVLGR